MRNADDGDARELMSELLEAEVAARNLLAATQVLQGRLAALERAALLPPGSRSRLKASRFDMLMNASRLQGTAEDAGAARRAVEALAACQLTPGAAP